MIRKIVMRLVRKQLGLKIGEAFRFDGQRSPVDYYYFTDESLVKVVVHKLEDGTHYTTIRPSGVSLNYITSDICKIVKCDKYG